MARHHHLHRINKKKQKDPLDFLLYFFTIATPLFEVPQAIAIYSSKSAANVSLLTWVFFLISDIVLLVYAVRHNIKPLVIMYAFYFIVEVTIVVGIVIYR